MNDFHDWIDVLQDLDERWWTWWACLRDRRYWFGCEYWSLRHSDISSWSQLRQPLMKLRRNGAFGLTEWRARELCDHESRQIKHENNFHIDHFGYAPGPNGRSRFFFEHGWEHAVRIVLRSTFSSIKYVFSGSSRWCMESYISDLLALSLDEGSCKTSFTGKVLGVLLSKKFTFAAMRKQEWASCDEALHGWSLRPDHQNGKQFAVFFL